MSDYGLPNCTGCGKVFKNKTGLTIHQRSCKSNENKDFYSIYKTIDEQPKEKQEQEQAPIVEEVKVNTTATQSNKGVKRASNEQKIKELEEENKTLKSEIIALQHEISQLTRELSIMKTEKLKSEKHSLVMPYADDVFDRNKAEERFDQTRSILKQYLQEKGCFALIGDFKKLGECIAEAIRGKYQLGDNEIFVEENIQYKRMNFEQFVSLVSSTLKEVNGSNQHFMTLLDNFAEHIPDVAQAKINCKSVYKHLIKDKNMEAWKEVFMGLLI